MHKHAMWLTACFASSELLQAVLAGLVTEASRIRDLPKQNQTFDKYQSRLIM